MSSFLFRVSLIWAPPMPWWCHTGRASSTLPSSSPSSITCLKGELWCHNHDFTHPLKKYNNNKFFKLPVYTGSPIVAWGCCGQAPPSLTRLFWFRGWSSVRDPRIRYACVFISGCFLFMVFLFVQANTGLTSAQGFGGTSRSLWRLSGRLLCFSADQERCRSSQQTRSVTGGGAVCSFDWISSIDWTVLLRMCSEQYQILKEKKSTGWWWFTYQPRLMVDFCSWLAY